MQNVFYTANCIVEKMTMYLSNPEFVDATWGKPSFNLSISYDMNFLCITCSEHMKRVRGRCHINQIIFSINKVVNSLSFLWLFGTC